MKLFNYALPLAMLFSTSGVSYAQAPDNFIEFNGTDQCVKIQSHEDFNIETTESFSITCWVNVNEFKNGQRFVSRRLMGETSQTTGYEMWGGGNSSQYYAVNTPKVGSSNILSKFNSGTGTIGTWMHIAMVINRTNNSVTLYKDGVKGVDVTNNPDMNSWSVVNNNDVYLGCGFNATSKSTENFMNGKLANVRFWNKALEQNEVAADMTLTVDENTENLIAAYDFKNISGLTVPDLSGNGHDGTLVGFAPVGGDTEIYAATVKADSNYTGRGNTNEVAGEMNLSISGEGDYLLKNIQLDLTGTTSLSDITSIKIYSTTENVFDSRNVENATLLGSCTPESNNVTCSINKNIAQGTNYLWITFDVKEDAKEGNKVCIKATEVDGKEVVNDGEASREILLARKNLFRAEIDGAVAYRIPVLTTAWDGSLVAITDNRKYSTSDIPQDIDIVVRRSTDNGKTWSEPVTMAKGTGFKQGFGDACIVKTNTENELLCMFIGGQGLGASTPYDRIKTYVSRSQDNGQTWSTPEDISSQIFAGERSNWYASFCAAGNGLKTRNGILMFVAAMRHNSSSTLYNHVVYSNDNGETWNVSNCAMMGGDESKVVELNDGRILMSIRHQGGGERFYTISDNVPTKDEPVSWTQKNTSTCDSWADMIEPACNGDIVRYTSTIDGYDKDRILHTVPNDRSTRQNVSMFISYDEGKTWSIKKTLCKALSAYSSIAILNDGTIGVYLEDRIYNPNQDEYDVYSTHFLNFSLDWLTNGADIYTEPDGRESVATPVFSLEEGYYSEEQTLEITTETEGASIYYTLDGTTPTNESTLYTEPIKLTETVTVKAIAMKDGMSNSTMTSATYTFLTEWEQPTGTTHPSEDRYVTSATTTGAEEELNYTNNSKPSTVFIDTQAAFTVTPGQEFTINIKSTEDMKWCHAILFADWNRDFDFNDENEQLMKIGVEGEGGNISSTGNKEVIDFTRTITVPEDAKAGETRLRIQFTDAWHDKTPGHTHTAMDNIDKGGCYDFIMNITSEPSIDVAKITFNEPENGKIEVRFPGEEELINNNDNVPVGENVEITLVPDTDYEVASLKINGTDRTGDVADNKLVVEVPAEELNIEAEFAPVTKVAKLTFNTPENGNIEVRYVGEEDLLNNNDEIIVGAKVEITLVPNTDYKVASLKINGTDKTEDVADNKLVVEVPAETLNIEAEFSPVTGINESQLTEVTVRPTVFDSEVVLTSNSRGEARFYDITGQILMTTDLNEGENVLSTSNLPSGSIILVVTTAEGTKSFNLIRK